MSRVTDLPSHTILYQPPMAIDIDQSGFHGRVAFLCAYADKTAFLTIAAGTIETFVLPGGIVMQRIVPLRHPEYPNLLANAIHAEGVGLGAGGYTNCRIVVEFASVPYATDGDRPFMEISLDQGGTHTTVPGEGMKFGDNTPMKRDHGIFVPEQAYQVTTYFNPGLGDDLIDGVLGKINSVPFLNKAVGCARFDGCRTQITPMMSGAVTYRKNFSMTFRRRPWNQLIRPGMTWDTPVGSTNGLPMHESTDLNVLL